MMKHEFEEIAGYEVTWEDYNNIIEPMYMALNVSKHEFVKIIDKKRFALKPLKSIEKEMKQIAEHLKETCTHYIDTEAREKLDDLAREYVERKYGGYAHYMIETEELWSCYYPDEITIYNKNTYKTIEVLKVA